MASYAISHAEQMDAIYRWQQPIYDATRKYYLFGRDGLIEALALDRGGNVLEIGCGTGRNLSLVARRWPRARLHGLDISEAMLEVARAKLLRRATLAAGDACRFDPQALLGQPRFDRVMVSYALSMIPDWQAALAQAMDVLGPEGQLHIVDFGPCDGLPAPLRRLLYGWLARFHVTPRLDLGALIGHLARERGLAVEAKRGPLGYYQSFRVGRHVLTHN